MTAGSGGESRSGGEGAWTEGAHPSKPPHPRLPARSADDTVGRVLSPGGGERGSAISEVMIRKRYENLTWERRGSKKAVAAILNPSSAPSSPPARTGAAPR
ncbi:hypothetical protein E4V01_18020 [Methylorubrum sp. Q1]|nr:hypothetical protein E4V01_18020 [Methylorubrum sp. Q1]